MGFLGDMASASKPREFDLAAAVSVEELFAKMQANASEFEIPFSLKSGLGGKKIAFDKVKELDASFNVTVKNAHVKISMIIQENSTTVGVGGFSMRVDKSAGEIASLPQKRGEAMDKIAEAIKKIMA